MVHKELSRLLFVFILYSKRPALQNYSLGLNLITSHQKILSFLHYLLCVWSLSSKIYEDTNFSNKNEETMSPQNKQEMLPVEQFCSKSSNFVGDFLYMFYSVKTVYKLLLVSAGPTMLHEYTGSINLGLVIKKLE